jgi:hypothetical protein
VTKNCFQFISPISHASHNLFRGSLDAKEQDCHLALKKAKSALFGLFRNSFLEIKGFGQLATLPRKEKKG